MKNPYNLAVIFNRFLGIALIGIGFLLISWFFEKPIISFLFASSIFFVGGAILELQADRLNKKRNFHDLGLIDMP